MSYQLAAIADPPTTVRLNHTSVSALRTLLDAVPAADPSIAYRPDLSTLLVATDDGTAYFTLPFPDGPHASVVCYAVAGVASTDAATATLTAARGKLLAAVRAALAADPDLSAQVRVPSTEKDAG